MVPLTLNFQKQTTNILFLFIDPTYIRILKNEQTDKEQTCLVMMHVKENQSLKMMGQEQIFMQEPVL